MRCYIMPDLGPMGRGGARRRTRRRMTAMNEMQNAQEQPETETEVRSDDSRLEKLGKLLKDKGVISETEYNLIFD